MKNNQLKRLKNQIANLVLNPGKQTSVKETQTAVKRVLDGRILSPPDIKKIIEPLSRRIVKMEQKGPGVKKTPQEKILLSSLEKTVALVEKFNSGNSGLRVLQILAKLKENN